MAGQNNFKELEDLHDDHDDADYEFSHDHPFADELPTNVVGKNHAQNSAHMHVTGQSKYFDDIPFAVNEGFFAPILSQKPHAKELFNFDRTRISTSSNSDKLIIIVTQL